MITPKITIGKIEISGKITGLQFVPGSDSAIVECTFITGDVDNMPTPLGIPASRLIEEMSTINMIVDNKTAMLIVKQEMVMGENKCKKY